MASSRRKDKSTPTTDTNELITKHIEEFNYLLFSISDRDPLKIKELSTWSVESWYQFIYANNIHARKIEAQQKTNQNKSKLR
jgi:hypothetical protein